MQAGEVLFEARNVSKTFNTVKALSGLDFQVRAGEVMAVAGENGAGKSTLMKIIAGVYQPDKNSDAALYRRGQKVEYKTPKEAKQNGIVLIYQELSLVPLLTVAENIFLGSLPLKKQRIVDWKKLYENTQKVLDILQCEVLPRQIVADLPIAKQQMVEIARAIALDANILILDEPTSSLTDVEKERLFACIRRLKAANAAIVYITHRMDEIFEISDRITVLRDGCKTGELLTAEAKREDVISLMIGRTLDEYYDRFVSRTGGTVALRVENLTRPGSFSNISFSLRKGEILGLYGLIGSGRTEVVESIFGIHPASNGKIWVDGSEVSIRSSTDAVRYGIGLVPENRKEDGLVLDMDCKWNIALTSLDEVSNSHMIDIKKLLALYNEYKDKLSLATPSPNQIVRNLSGGNQQKVVISKWLAIRPNILMLDEPTRGIDVGSKAEIHKLIGQLAGEGMAVIMISSEMPEIIGVCSRVITMINGGITDEFADQEISEANIMHSIMM